MSITYNPDNGEKKEFAAIPQNTLVDVEVVDVTLKPLNEEFRQKFQVKDTHEVSFHFKVTDGEYKNRHLWGTAKPYINDSEKCRLRIWAQELLGVQKLPEDFNMQEDPDTGVYDLFTGMEARVLVENYTQKSTGKVKDRVRDVLRSVNPTVAEEPF